MFVGFPYALAWERVAGAIVVGILAGATAGAVDGTKAKAAAI